jgi:hypothetical protein
MSSSSNVWQYHSCAEVNTDHVNMKEYKPQGHFYHDAAALCHLYGIKLHPMFREAPVAGDDNAAEHVGAFEDQKKIREPTSISVAKYRIDPNSMKVLFKVLEGCPHIQTLK